MEVVFSHRFRCCFRGLGTRLLIDRTHRTWMIVTAVLFAAATVAYVVYARASQPDGPQGGSVPGMLFGIAGSLLMIFAGLLSGRKRLPGWRVGSAKSWLRGHLWLGTLAGPLILFHAGFQWGGLLEQIILVLTFTIIISGLFGLMMQQVLPRTMASTIGAEAMYDQLPAVCQSLQAAADRTVTEACGPALVLSAPLQTNDPKELLAGFYRRTVRPFLAVDVTDSPLVQATSSAALFGELRQRVPQELGGCLDRLTQLCDERRQLLTQARLHKWMHGWLLLHIPLSAALLVLGVAHAIVAMWY